MSELQKAVSEAERKAHEMISTERAKMERTVAEAKRQAAEDALIIINQQEDSSEVGRFGIAETNIGNVVNIQSASLHRLLVVFNGNSFHPSFQR